MIIRTQESADRAAVHALHAAAFETSAEADLVDLLREQAEPLVSLVAEIDQGVVGHILFSPVTLTENDALRIMGLAPMAVAPAYQQRGIGSALVRAGLEQCRELGFATVVVLGHARYYPRFGFSPASCFGIKCEHDVPDDVFMIAKLTPGALGGRSGTVKYHAAFGSV